MTAFKLTSADGLRDLDGELGALEILENKITAQINPGARLTLIRGINKVDLNKISSETISVKGEVRIGDVFVLENDQIRKTYKVEEDLVPELVKTQIDPTPRQIFVRSGQTDEMIPTKKNTTLTVGVIILAILIISVVFGIRQKNQKEFIKGSEEKLAQATINYDKSVSLNSVDKNESRRLFLESKETAIKLKADGFSSQKLNDLLSRISEQESELLGEVSVGVDSFSDLTLQTSGFSGDKVMLSGKYIFVSDEKNKNVLLMNDEGKNTEVYAGKSVLENINHLTSYEKRLFGLSDDGLFEIKSFKDKLKEKTWGSSLMYSYSGNVYLVDKDNNKILRLSGDGKSFSDPADWLAPGVEVDFSKVVDMTIDGSIWLLSSTGKVTRFVNGNPQVVLMKGIVNEIKNPTAIYTNENLKNVYILDRENGRVVVIEKNGNFKVQYTNESIKNARDLVVVGQDQKIILLSGGKLESINTKQ